MTWSDRATQRWTLDLVGDEWQGHFVYVALGASKRARPLYIGKTSALRQRIAAHMARSKWSSEVASFAFYRYETAEDATEAEVAAILELDPKYNIVRKRFTGPLISAESIRPDQLAIIRRVQDRGRAA